MFAKRPKLQDYGITPDQYALYQKKGTYKGFGLAWIIAFLLVGSTVFSTSLVITRDLEEALEWFRGVAVSSWLVIGVAAWIVIVVIARLVQLAITRFKRSLLLRGAMPTHIQLYEVAIEEYMVIMEKAEIARQEAERRRLENEKVQWEANRVREEAQRARRRALSEYWMSLGGVEFEEELGALYRQLGFHVQSTPVSGDEGIDLILRKDGKRIVVQCKGHKAPVGPAVVRELYGSMVAYRADKAILACTGGFTRGVIEFARGKPIELISASELAMMADWRKESGIREEQGNIQEVPRCPRCRKDMRLLSGRHDQFWSCTGYPRCIGTRKA